MPNFFEGNLVATGLRVGIVVSRWNAFITERLLDGALDTLKRHGVDTEGAVDVARVPGTFEVPLVAQRLAQSGRYDAVICLGCLIRGSTPHFDYIASECSKGIAQAMMQTGIPITFGILTTDSIEQAIERAGTKAGNQGRGSGGRGYRNGEPIPDASPDVRREVTAAGTSRFRFGAHLPTAGGLYKAVTGGAKIGCDAVQLFTSSPRQWKAAPPDTKAVRKFRRAVEATGIYPLIAHDSYLINLATPDPALREKSRQAFLEEMQRAELLGLDYVVTHMGAHTGAGEDAGIDLLCQSLDWLHRQIPDYRVRVALETTAGQGTCLGGVFDHFPRILSQVAESERLSVCMDTCHIFVAGYDLRDADSVKTTLDAFEEKVGLHRLCCLHANDAQKGLGSHLDRHAHIGAGCIGSAGFAALLADPRLPDGLPIIVETPDAETHHAINVWRLKQLAAPAAA